MLWRLFHAPKNFSNLIKRSLVNKRQNYCQNVLDVNTNVPKDVILFKYDNPRFYKIVNIFAVCQFVFWSYLSVFSYTTLKDAPVDKNKDDLPWWRRINLGENQYRNGITIFAFLVGYGILTVTWTFTLKSVRYLILCKGGQKLALVTYTPFGSNRILYTDLKDVNCAQSRSVAKSQLPIKIRNHYLYYILDMRGEFKNPQLFDHTAGVRRNWKTV